MSRRPAFKFHRPSGLEEAVARLATSGDGAKVIAGGQSLGPMLVSHLIAPAVLVDVNGVDDLRGITARGDEIVVGATTTQAAIARSSLVRDGSPLLAEATRWIAHPSVRERGTIGGSLAHNDPAAEYPAVLLALDARIRVARQGSERTVDASSLVEERILETAIDPDEIIIEIAVPRLRPRSGQAFLELAERRGDYAIVGAAVTITLDAHDDTVESARVCAVGGLYAKRLTDVEAALVGRRAIRDVILETARLAGDAVPVGDDIHASATYRRKLFSTLVARCLASAAAMART